MDNYRAKRGPYRPKLSRIEEYRLINGDYLTAREVARRLGVSMRTVVRYRAALRQS